MANMQHAELRALRTTVGVSQARVARECGLDRVRISLWEGGLVDLEPDEVARVEQYLQAALEEKLRQLGELRQVSA
jgi:transcriptional regulator with XRE-family HTH domain